MREYRCSRCAYIYAEIDGDPTANIVSGTKWRDLPADWACPHCGIEKTHFESILPQQKDSGEST